MEISIQNPHRCEILKKKEEICDVKVADFIEKNIRKYIDAYMPNKETISVKHGEMWYNFVLQ